MKLKLRTFQIGSPVKRGQGLRLGTTRYTPRGVRRERWQKDGYFDLWLPTVAPSRRLLQRKLDLDSFYDAYERELSANTEARQTVRLLAEIAKRTPISVGCYCQDEQRCHRWRLKAVIEKAAAGKWPSKSR